MHMETEYQGYVISWQEPPISPAQIRANIASNYPYLQIKIGASAAVIEGRSQADLMEKSMSFIDALEGAG